MALKRRDLIVGVMVAVPLLCTFAGYQAGARVETARPTVVATVDLNLVLKSLNEISDWQNKLSSHAKDLDDELKAKTEKLTSLKNQADAAAADQKDALDEDVRMQTLESQYWATIQQRQLDSDEAMMWQATYRNIKNAVKNLATAEGYDLVIVDDAAGEVMYERNSQVPAAQQIKAQIAGRSILFRGKDIDITEKLILRMNNEYTAVSGASGSTPARSNP